MHLSWYGRCSSICANGSGWSASTNGWQQVTCCHWPALSCPLSPVALGLQLNTTLIAGAPALLSMADTAVLPSLARVRLSAGSSKNIKTNTFVNELVCFHVGLLQPSLYYPWKWRRIPAWVSLPAKFPLHWIHFPLLHCLQLPFFLIFWLLSLLRQCHLSFPLYLTHLFHWLYFLPWPCPRCNWTFPSLCLLCTSNLCTGCGIKLKSQGTAGYLHAFSNIRVVASSRLSKWVG